MKYLRISLLQSCVDQRIFLFHLEVVPKLEQKNRCVLVFFFVDLIKLKLITIDCFQFVYLSICCNFLSFANVRTFVVAVFQLWIIFNISQLFRKSMFNVSIPLCLVSSNACNRVAFEDAKLMHSHLTSRSFVLFTSTAKVA